ncbi:ABC transporter permease [Polymorphospora rubra]|uniref:Exporter of polyketide antibiotics n=1 Tax=Polymorphospora rubra TaxID=338584 RepID=A0A810N554_9ACTN|nr:anibiotic ABC transporter [Polymorphospora rubra]BCJ68526.1 exporter of polyketide antibiotics [Polymorphospora rubra]
MSALTGTGRLARLALRRDRIVLPVWIVGVPAVGLAVAASVADLYGGEADRLVYAGTTAVSVVARAFNGPTSGASLGAVVVAETFTSLAVLVALMTTFTVVRHTRQNEETGRFELTGSAMVGRHAPLAAALGVAVGADLLIGAGVAAALVGIGLPVTGALAYGTAIAGVGAAFAAVAAVTAQVFSTSRAANSAAAVAVGVAFGLRAVGDALGTVDAGGLRVTSAWPSWLSPLGWANQVRPFDADHWAVLALPAVFSVVAVAVAAVLVERRDAGTGLVAPRPGPARAGAELRSAAGLAWRLHRGGLLGWAIGLAVLGVAMGAVADEVDALVGDNAGLADAIAQLGGAGGLVDAFLATIMSIVALMVAGYAVQAVLRAHAEESAGRLEAVAAGAVSRSRWLAGHLVCAAGGVLLLLALTGATVGFAYGATVADTAGIAGETARMTGAALAQAPAVFVLAGAVVAVFGLLPRWSAAVAWAALALCALAGQFGAVLDLPTAVVNASPFSHVPAVPADDVTAGPLLALLAVAAGLLAVGMVAFRRRDLAL